MDKSGRIRTVCLFIDDNFGKAFQCGQCGIQRDDSLAVIKEESTVLSDLSVFWIGGNDVT